MDNHLKIITQILATENAGKIPPRRMAGSSDSSVYLANGKIYRLGRKDEINDELKLIEEFRQLNIDFWIFPAIFQTTIRGEIMIAEMEFIGEQSIEDLLLSFRGSDSEFNRLIAVNRRILSLLDGLFLQTANSNGALNDKLGFYHELIAALQLNLAKAELLDDEATVLISRLENYPNLFLSDLILSKIHKDLSVGNVIIGSDDQPKLIDPRRAVPNLKVGSFWGSSAFDLVGYRVSLMRKIAEVKQNGTTASLIGLIEETDLELKKGLVQKRFNPAMVELCHLVWYSIYCACRCDYCLAPERLWLYQKMKNELGRYLTTIDGLTKSRAKS